MLQTARLDMDPISQKFVFFERSNRFLSQMSGAYTSHTESDGFLLKSAGTAVVAAKGASIPSNHSLGCPPSLSKFNTGIYLMVVALSTGIDGCNSSMWHLLWLTTKHRNTPIGAI